jgi:N-acetylmuramoyl-L-alanine amidase
VEEAADKLVLSVARPGLTDRGDDVRNETSVSKPTETPKPTEVNTPTSTREATGTVIPSTTPNPGDLTVAYSKVGSRDEVSLIMPEYKDYKIVRYTDPDKIVIDIPNAKTQADQKTININSALIKNIRYSMHNANTVRVVLDVTGQPMYSADEQEGRLVIALETPAYKNITYHNSGDRVGFILPNVKLTENDANLKRLYTGNYDESRYNYTITFPSSQGNVGSGTFYINDGYLDKVVISTDASTGKTSITFEAFDEYVYNIITRSNAGNTAITLLKPAKEGEKLVVIDPGHGGFEPGAESFGTLEKNFNLDISLRLNNLLKANGINSYIIREDDSYIGLYERAYIANNLNASLFLSIHNNAFYAKENGTETLYYPNRTNSSGLTGKRFAQIIQSNLVSDLGMHNRGIVERPNLVVLKATTMPAALAEIAFMTNKNDFAKLQSEDFRQKSAQSLCDSVIQALSEIK